MMARSPQFFTFQKIRYGSGTVHLAAENLLRTSNGLEWVNKEVRRRTWVATLFPSEESCLRLVSAVLMEISDEWEAGRAYLTFENEDQ